MRLGHLRQRRFRVNRDQIARHDIGAGDLPEAPPIGVHLRLLHQLVQIILIRRAVFLLAGDVLTGAVQADLVLGVVLDDLDLKDVVPTVVVDVRHVAALVLGKNGLHRCQRRSLAAA